MPGGRGGGGGYSLEFLVEEFFFFLVCISNFRPKNAIFVLDLVSKIDTRFQS